MTKDTQAWIGANNSVDFAATQGSLLGGVSDGSRPKGTSFGQTSFHGLAVQARSSENFFGLVIAIGGGLVGIGVPVNVTLLKATTSAFISTGTSLNTVLAPGAGQSVEVAALDSFKSFTIAGGVGVGFVGVGAAIDIGIADTSTTAYIAAGTHRPRGRRRERLRARVEGRHDVRDRDRRRLRRRRGRRLGLERRHRPDAHLRRELRRPERRRQRPTTDAPTSIGAPEPTTEADNEVDGNGSSGYRQNPRAA